MCSIQVFPCLNLRNIPADRCMLGRKETWGQSLERRVINGENESKLLGNWKEQGAVQNQFSISCEECMIPEDYQVDVLVIYCGSVKTVGCSLPQMVIL